jgi:hypothetical protein
VTLVVLGLALASHACSRQVPEDGPYEINEASGLIPAHANCRCAFVPAEDARFADPVEELASLNLSEEP